VCDTIFHFGKIQLKIAKLRLDLKFLKNCKCECLLPKFVRFRLSASHLHYSSSFVKCQQDILKCEIKLKKRELSRLYRHSNRIKDFISANVERLLYVRILTIINRLTEQRQNQWSKTYEQKLNILRQSQQQSLSYTPHVFEYPKNPVRNYSKRTLTDEEYTALVNGLDFVYCTRKLDEQ